MEIPSEWTADAVTADVQAIARFVETARSSGRRIGFVPTMGALHAGHLSLVDASRRYCEATIVSVYVNPVQFLPHEDLSKYPRPIERDVQLLEDRDVDLIFVPTDDVIYPVGYGTYVDPQGAALPLEGQHRPGHFRGVATVVQRLFAMVRPDLAFFGQKDYQQTLVVRQMVRDLLLPVQVIVCPTVRESDGLAMSSRNAYLQPEQREQATGLYRALRAADELFLQGERRAAVLCEAMHEMLREFRIEQIDYAVAVEQQTLEPRETLSDSAVALLAVRVGGTRLIDNMLLGQQPAG